MGLMCTPAAAVPRYDVTACPTKVVPGLYGFVAQLNEGRYSKKRPTEFRVDQVVQVFDANKFNFNKAYKREVLFAFEPQAKPGRYYWNNCSLCLGLLALQLAVIGNFFVHHPLMGLLVVLQQWTCAGRPMVGAPPVHVGGMLILPCVCVCVKAYTLRQNV